MRPTSPLPVLPRTRRVIPNAFSMLNLSVGLIALLGIASGWSMATVLLLLAVALVCDLLDGRLARALEARSAFGVQIDSLADLVSFGLVPAAVLYAEWLWPWRAAGVAVSVLLVLAAAGRLARFNAEAGDADAVAAPAGFTGLPVTIPAAIIVGTAAAGLALPAVLVAAIALGLSALMISRVPYVTFKDRPVYLLALGPLLTFAFAIAIAAAPFIGAGVALASLGVAYALSGVVTRVIHRQEPEAH